MKKRTKQILAALFSAAMVLSVTACGSETAEEKGTVSDSSKEEGGSEKIELSVSHIMVNESDSQVAAWNKALGEYKETHPDIVIKEDKADNDAYKTKLKTTLAAGSASDIFYSWGGGFSESFVEAGIVENLDSYVESGVIDMDKMMPNICNNFYYDDSLYGLPLDSFMGVLMCNQELFDKYNLEVPKTMEELYHVSEVFLENGITPLALGEKDKWPGLFPFGILSLRYGGVEENTALLNGEGNFDQEFVKRAAGELENLVEKGVFSDSAVALTNDEAKNDQMKAMSLNLAKPSNVTLYIRGVEESGEIVEKFASSKKSNVLVLVKNTKDALVVAKNSGGVLKEINVGGLRYEEGKKKLTDLVAVDDDDINNFKQIGDLGIDIEFRMLPRDKKKQLSDLIK